MPPKPSRPAHAMNGRPPPLDVRISPSRPRDSFSNQMTAMLHQDLSQIQAAKPPTAPPMACWPPAATPGAKHAQHAQHAQHSSQTARQPQQHQSTAHPGHLRGRGRVLSYHSGTAHSAQAHAQTSASSPPSPASARSSRSHLPEPAPGHRPAAMRGGQSGATSSRQCPVSRMHGHLPPTTPAMELLERTAVALRARVAMAAPSARMPGGLAQNGSCSSVNTGVYVDSGGCHGDGSDAGVITGKRGLTNLPLLQPLSPKIKRRRYSYRPYSVHAPRYRIQVARRPQSSNALRKQLMGKGRRQ